MPWDLRIKKHVAILEMNSSPANLHNPIFFKDFHHAFDRIDQEAPELPIILTSKGKIFCAGIDFNYSFSLFEKGETKAVAEWFHEYQKMMLRLFTCPRMTIGAINGHTFAGGAILALCCDFRIAAQGDYKISINEVPVGIPMPSVYTEIIRFRLGDTVANDLILSGEMISPEQAQNLGFVRAVVPTENLEKEASRLATNLSPKAYPAYRFSKKALQFPTLEKIENYSSRLEPEMFELVCDPQSVEAQRAALSRLQQKS